MKNLTEVYIDLSKCSEEQQKHMFSLLPEPPKDVSSPPNICGNLCLIFSDKWMIINRSSFLARTELPYPEFIKMFEGGEEKKINMTFGITDKHTEIINKQITRFEGAEFDRLSWEKIAKEIGWDLPTIILWYFRKKESKSKWIKIESKSQYDLLENGEYHWYNINTGRYDKGDLWEFGTFTHYQPVIIIKPEPPKF